MSELPPENLDDGAGDGAEDWADEQHVADLFSGPESKSLHDRLQSRIDDAARGPDRLSRAGHNGGDPFAELKSRVHHACIRRLGPELFRSDVPQKDLTDRVQ